MGHMASKKDNLGCCFTGYSFRLAARNLLQNMNESKDKLLWFICNILITTVNCINLSASVAGITGITDVPLLKVIAIDKNVLMYC